MTTFTWLHLTDLHLGMSGLRDLWPNVEENFLRDVEYLLKQSEATLDLVLFSGDLVQSGKPKEYDNVNRLLERFWGRFREMGCNPSFLAIPGNHDLNWADYPKDPASVLLLDSWHLPHVQEQFWNDPGCIQRRLVNRAFANYVNWWENVPVPRPKLTAAPQARDFPGGTLPGDLATTIEKEKVRLGILGLNTSFLQLTGGDRKGRLAVSARQFQMACGGHGPDWVEKHDVCLLATHHPPDWLTEEARGQLNGEIHFPAERFALHLFGHMHEGSLSSLAVGGFSARRRLQGYSLFGMEGWGTDKQERIHGYSLCQIATSGDGASLRIWPRMATRKGGGLSIDRDQSLLPTGKEATDWLPVTVSQRPRQAEPDARPVPAAPAPQPLLGRDADIAECADLLLQAGVRMLVLTGPPGVGKSVLAQHVADRVRDAFCGVRFVRLAALKDPGEAAAEIARRCPLPPDAGDSAPERCPDHKPVLLVLDRFEHVIAAAPDLTNLLLDHPSLRILVTSQRSLAAVEPEIQRWALEREVPPLPAPDGGTFTDLLALNANAAVALFRMRARATRGDFEITTANAFVVAEICGRLDNLPLAIEVAAGEIRGSRPEDILRDLREHGIAGLDSGQKLVCLIDRCYRLLDDDERCLFRRLSAFPAGCTLEAMEALYRNAADPHAPVSKRLRSLAQRSLLRPGQGRYMMLHTIRDFALKELEGSPEAEPVRQWHARYFLDLAGDQEPLLITSERRAALDRLDAEYGNLESVLAWGLGADGRTPGGEPAAQDRLALGARLAGRLFWLWNFRGRFQQGRDHLKGYLARSGELEAGDTLAKLFYADGGLAFLQGDSEVAIDQLERSVGIWRALAGDAGPGLAYTLIILGMSKAEQGRSEQDDQERRRLLQEAQAHEEESRAIFAALDHGPGLALALNDLGTVTAAGSPDPASAEARGRYDESLALWRRLGDRWGETLTLSHLGLLSCRSGDYAGARRHYEAALEIQKAEGDIWGLAWSQMGLGDVAAAEGKHPEAAECYYAGFTLNWQIGRLYIAEQCVKGLRAVAESLGRTDLETGLSEAARRLHSCVNHRSGSEEERQRQAKELRRNPEQFLKQVADCAAELMGRHRPRSASGGTRRRT